MANSNATVDIRAAGDRDLAKLILEKPGVADVIEKYEKVADEMGARRHLLATSLRLTAEMAPRVHEIVDSCRNTLHIEAPIEIFVYPELQYNAAAVRPEGGRLFMMFSAGLLEGFEERELEFVVGHELGHHLFNHHKIPTAPLIQWAKSNAPHLVLKLFAWQRYAEISSDRAGVLCAKGLDPAAHALFKLASGLRGNRIQVRIDQFLAQMGDLKKEYERLSKADEPIRSDWFSTHPFSPLRVRAIQLFSESELFVKEGISKKQLEERIDELIRLMDPSYLQDNSEGAEAMRRLLFAGAILIATSGKKVDEKALKALEELLGPGAIPSSPNADAIQDELKKRIERVKAIVPPLRRAQVIRDLCVIARADNKVTRQEKKILFDIAEQLEVDKELVTCTLAEES